MVHICVDSVLLLYLLPILCEGGYCYLLFAQLVHFYVKLYKILLFLWNSTIFIIFSFIAKAMHKFASILFDTCIIVLWSGNDNIIKYKFIYVQKYLHNSLSSLYSIITFSISLPHAIETLFQQFTVKHFHY